MQLQLLRQHLVDQISATARCQGLRGTPRDPAYAPNENVKTGVKNDVKTVVKESVNGESVK
jgi:hypothetical protein